MQQGVLLVVGLCPVFFLLLLGVCMPCFFVLCRPFALFVWWASRTTSFWDEQRDDEATARLAVPSRLFQSFSRGQPVPPSAWKRSTAATMRACVRVCVWVCVYVVESALARPALLRCVCGCGCVVDSDLVRPDLLHSVCGCSGVVESALVRQSCSSPFLQQQQQQQSQQQQQRQQHFLCVKSRRDVLVCVCVWL